MSKILYLSEIVKFAVEKEQQAEALYAELHEKAVDTKAKAVFKELMEQELKHEKLYEAMLKDIPDEQSPNIAEDSEYFGYMQELINESRKIAPTTDLDFNNLKEVFQYAIDREKDSILFYVGMKNFAPKSAHETIDHIIAEEGKHITMITGLRNHLGL